MSISSGPKVLQSASAFTLSCPESQLTLAMVPHKSLKDLSFDFGREVVALVTVPYLSLTVPKLRIS